MSAMSTMHAVYPTPTSSPKDTMSIGAARSSSDKVWVEPSDLPDYGNVSHIAGNAPEHVKRLTSNTFFGYAVGSPECFGSQVGKRVRFIEISINKGDSGRTECKTIQEAIVSREMLNGAGMCHGGCLAYLIDDCCPMPLVALGVHNGTNAVGVTQSMNVSYHAPASPGMHLRIVSVSVSLGRRTMTSRCEVFDKNSGRLIASATMSRMEPRL